MDVRRFRSIVGAISIAGTMSTLLVSYHLQGASFFSGFFRIFYLVPLLLATEYVFTVWHWIGYQPVKGIEDNSRLPSISVVIPAYNESSFVRNSIRSVLLSDYPTDRLELVIVDDGSQDDTWMHINKAVGDTSMCQISCLLLRHETNLGKRHAIRTGFMAARGEIIVSLDSDSILEKQALRNLISPFLHDADIGGVAGHLVALNVPAPGKHNLRGVVPRLLDILFDNGGNIPRTAQSMAGFVTILPGALSAYRAAAARQHVDDLCTRTFLGGPLKHGEDVEITYYMLRDGWKTIYQSNAVVHTTVPESPRRSFLMYTRWERSSYVFMSMGYLSLALQEARNVLVPGSRMMGALSSATDKERQMQVPGIFQGRPGSLYPALNMLCISFGNIFLVTLGFRLMAGLVLDPAGAPFGLAVLALFSAWKSLLCIADAVEEEMPDEDDVGGVLLYSRAARLIWRLQYGWLAHAFQMIYVSWSSLAGLLTLRSQGWLTR